MAPRPPERKPASPSVSPAASQVGAAPYLTSSRIASTARGALVIDGDSGTLVAIDEAGKVLARHAVGRGAGQLAYDPHDERVYVADRRSDRIVALDARDLRVLREWKTPAEPFGVALTPDRKTLLVTTIADRTLAVYDTDDGKERWRARIAAGARGVSITPNGTLAVISSITQGSFDLVELTGEHRIAQIPYDLTCDGCQRVSATARGSGSIRFVDNHRAITTMQRSVPDSFINTKTGTYGGGGEVGRRPTAAITQHVVFLTFSLDPANPGVGQRSARIAEHTVRGFVWDERRDILYLLGLGSDTMLKLPHPWEARDLPNSTLLATPGKCGPESVALAPNGDLLAWCSLTNTVLRLHDDDQRESGTLVASAMSGEEQFGNALFNTTSGIINSDLAFACASCHIEGGTDGLSWRIGPQALQTPILAGRINGTHPFKWDGSDTTLAATFATTTKRLGGSGLDEKESNAIAAYLKSLPPPRPPTGDAVAIARGKQLFESRGCTTCHDGPTYNDGEQYEFTSLLKQLDTPSLRGLAWSAPYYHDGSATSLDSLLRGDGRVVGMSAELVKLTAAERRDLASFLESL